MTTTAIPPHQPLPPPEDASSQLRFTQAITSDLTPHASTSFSTPTSEEAVPLDSVRQRSNSLTQVVSNTNNNHNDAVINGVRRYSADTPSSTTATVGGGSTTFWKQTSKVPGSIKAVKTPPRVVIQQGPPLTTTPPRPDPTSPLKDSASTTTNFTSLLAPSPTTPPNSNNAQQQPPLAFHNSPPPVVHRDPNSVEIPRSKSSSFVAVGTTFAHGSNGLTSSNGSGEYIHRCTEWKNCGRVGETAKLDRFRRILNESVIDMENLKKNCWKGIPCEVRAHCWKLLLGYLPVNADRREAALQRKRQEYHENVIQYYHAARTEDESSILKQILLDLPRTSPKPLFQLDVVHRMLERILYVWAIRHPASDYVQGINDIATPFFVVFLSDFLDDVENCESLDLPPEVLGGVEADTYWCLSKFLDGIQDFYTFAQPGIQRMTYRLQELVGRVDQPLMRHLQAHEVQFMNFSLRWMNCVLVREIPLPLVARMYDTYLAEGEGFSTFHLYVCAAFLYRWSAELRLLDFQEIFLFLQRPPTAGWTCKDIELLLSQAFLWMETFQNAPAHLKSSIA